MRHSAVAEDSHGFGQLHTAHRDISGQAVASQLLNARQFQQSGDAAVGKGIVGNGGTLCGQFYRTEVKAVHKRHSPNAVDGGIAHRGTLQTRIQKSLATDAAQRFSEREATQTGAVHESLVAYLGYECVAVYLDKALAILEHSLRNVRESVEAHVPQEAATAESMSVVESGATKRGPLETGASGKSAQAHSACAFRQDNTYQACVAESHLP